MHVLTGLSPVLTLRLVTAFLAVLVVWFGYWELGTLLARAGLPYWSLPATSTEDYVWSMSLAFSALTRIMLAAQIASLILVMRRHRWVIWTFVLGAVTHLISWVWITGAGWFDGGPGFFIIIGEVLSLYALWRLRVTGHLR